MSAIRLERAGRTPTGKRGRAAPLDGSVTIAEMGAGVALMRVDLPRDTPPGTYEGSVQVGDEERRIVVDVEPEVFLRLFPETLSLTVEPGADVEVTLTLVNIGNAPADIRGASMFGVFEVGGAERAIASSFIGTVPKGERRLDRFADAVADSHGGMIRVKVLGGSGEIAPGDIKELRLRLSIPDRIERGRTYSGLWALFNLGYPVQVIGAAPRKGPAARQRTSKEAPG
jgi:hypothetical protein